MVDEFDFDAPKSATFFEEKENEPFVLNKNASSASRISNLNSSKSRQNCNGLYSSRVNSNLCTNHNQNDEYAKPPTITSSSTESSSRQLSSTLQSNRSPELFHPDISEIQNASLKPEKNISTTLNGSSSSTLFYHSNLYKDLNLDESSKAMALKYLNSPRTNEKKADISERSSKLLDSLKARSNNNAAVKPQPEKPHQFSLNSLVDHFSSFTRPTTPTSKSRPEIAIKPEPLSHWGFVAIGQEIRSKIFVQNLTSQLLQISPIINDATGSFKLASNDTVYIYPNMAEEFSVIFSPKECKRYRSKIKFVVTSSGNHFYHTLFGYGGTAEVKIVQKNCITYFPKNLIYRCTPSDLSHFTFEIENIGNRSTFVHIAAFDEIENDSNRVITVTPESFCLAGNNNNPTKRMITVTYKQQTTRSSLDSAASFSSTSSGNSKNRLITLKIFFGDERLRQRATKYSDQINRHQHYCGLLLTKTSFLLNGKEINASDKDAVSKQDIEMLKAQTRVLTIIVGDDRISHPLAETQSLSSRPPSSHSLHSSENGFYIPQCNKGDLEESMISNVTNCDRTFYK